MRSTSAKHQQHQPVREPLTNFNCEVSKTKSSNMNMMSDDDSTTPNQNYGRMVLKTISSASSLDR